jgi:aspartyl-tRNA(Asn)/glutamyl-tRNA(Gln) amidotransferase subunit C
MAVSEEDVRHVAGLARLGLDPDRIESLVRELNGILDHMKVLDAVDPSAYVALGDGRSTALPLRADEGPPLPLSRPLEQFAPEMRDGFFIVPRLATHEGEIEETA